MENENKEQTTKTSFSMSAEIREKIDRFGEHTKRGLKNSLEYLVATHPEIVELENDPTTPAGNGKVLPMKQAA